MCLDVDKHSVFCACGGQMRHSAQVDPILEEVALFQSGLHPFLFPLTVENFS